MHFLVPIYVWNKNVVDITLDQAIKYLVNEQIHLVWSLKHCHIEPMIPIDPNINFFILIKSQKTINLINENVVANFNPIERNK